MYRMKDNFDEIAICNLAVLLPYREGLNGDYLSSTYEYVAALALAAQHLNSGDEFRHQGLA